jgi:LmbE family N-acetylglucosaminyl deacetylase
VHDGDAGRIELPHVLAELCAYTRPREVDARRVQMAGVDTDPDARVPVACVEHFGCLFHCGREQVAAPRGELHDEVAAWDAVQEAKHRCRGTLERGRAVVAARAAAVHDEARGAEARAARERELEAFRRPLEDDGITRRHVHQVGSVQEERHRALVEPLAERGFLVWVGIGHRPAPGIRGEDLQCPRAAFLGSMQRAAEAAGHEHVAADRARSSAGHDRYRTDMAETTPPERALAVYAHPDDPEISAGGTLARWAAEGTEVSLLITTRGDKGSQDPAVDRDELARLRRDETAAAAELLGFAGHYHLDYDDGDLPDNQELRAEIVRHVRMLRPDAVLCPDPTAVFFGDGYYNHRDHRVTGWTTLDAVAPAAGNPHYFREHLGEGLKVHHVREVYLSGTLEPNCWIDISDALERKIDALFCHSSQLVETGEWFRQFLRDRAEEAGRAAGVRYAEGFRKLTFG